MWNTQFVRPKKIVECLKGEEAPDTFRVAKRSENPSEFGGSTMTYVSPVVAPTPTPVTTSAPTLGSALTPTPIGVANKIKTNFRVYA